MGLNEIIQLIVQQPLQVSELNNKNCSPDRDTSPEADGGSDKENQEVTGSRWERVHLSSHIFEIILKEACYHNVKNTSLLTTSYDTQFCCVQNGGVTVQDWCGL